MFLKTSVLVALAVCGLGLLYKIRLWMTVSIGDASRDLSPGQRLAAAIKGLFCGIFSLRIFPALGAFILDGLLQRRVWRHSRLAWLAHECIFLGFMGLLFMHALGDVLTARIFKDYYPTVSPYMFLRDLSGVVVILGVVLAIYRRFTVPGMKFTTRGIDRFALALVGFIIISGFALEALKIDSHKRFEEMVQDYAVANDDNEIADLRVFWSQKYGVIFPKGQGEYDADALERGATVNENACASCHVPPQTAFASYTLGQLIRPIAVALTDKGAEDLLWYLHILACMVGLAILPFTKFLHLFTSPFLLMIQRAVGDPKSLSPANLANLRALELDACTHCAACSVHCSVAVAMKQVPNANILPSEKLNSLMRMAGARFHKPDRAELARIRQGSYICSSCLRCTTTCPVGINLQDLWLAMKEDLAAQGLPATSLAVKNSECRAAQPSRSLPVLKVGDRSIQTALKHSALSANFSSCFRCMTCSNACPVVRMYPKPMEALDLMPHQIMHSLGLGLKEEAMGARMTWNCLTCYLCQEACPQRVRVADILYELRHLAAATAPDLEV